MQAYSAYINNGLVIPFGNPDLPEGAEVIIVVSQEAMPKEENSPVRRPFPFGCMKGKVRMADDFDAPMEDFGEYM